MSRTVLFHLHISHTHSLFKQYRACRNRTFKRWGKIHVHYVHFLPKMSLLSTFWRNWTLSFFKSLRVPTGIPTGISVGVFGGQLNLPRLGLVGSLSTFLPKDSCLGAKKRKRHTSDLEKLREKTPKRCAVGWGKLLENPVGFFFHANWCYIYIYYN